MIFVDILMKNYIYTSATTSKTREWIGMGIVLMQTVYKWSNITGIYVMLIFNKRKRFLSGWQIKFTAEHGKCDHLDPLKGVVLF